MLKEYPRCGLISNLPLAIVFRPPILQKKSAPRFAGAPSPNATSKQICSIVKPAVRLAMAASSQSARGHSAPFRGVLGPLAAQPRSDVWMLRR